MMFQLKLDTGCDPVLLTPDRRKLDTGSYAALGRNETPVAAPGSVRKPLRPTAYAPCAPNQTRDRTLTSKEERKETEHFHQTPF
jgi:hypothetical protein